MANRLNLNTLAIPSVEGQDEHLADGAVETPTASVYFRDLESRLIGYIDAADYVFGCVAWLTNERILAALAERRGVSIIVQKEDFLRPDSNAQDGWQRQLRVRFGVLPSMIRYQFPGVVGRLSVCGDPTLDGVRCMGSLTTNKRFPDPRMHHKFAVFAREAHGADCDGTQDVGSSGAEVCNGCRLEPYAVWTGSFNWTQNATDSLENAVVLRDPAIVQAYFREFQQIVGLSEPLNWTHEWVEPEWRIGT